jgi:hypothetical protein
MSRRFQSSRSRGVSSDSQVLGPLCHKDLRASIRQPHTPLVQSLFRINPSIDANSLLDNKLRFPRTSRSREKKSKSLQ